MYQRARHRPRARPRTRMRSRREPTSQDYHRIAVRIEAITSIDGGAIGAHCQIVAGESGNEHDEGRAWEMEVGDQAIHGAKAVWRPNEDARLAFTRANRSV